MEIISPLSNIPDPFGGFIVGLFENSQKPHSEPTCSEHRNLEL